MWIFLQKRNDLLRIGENEAIIPWQKQQQGLLLAVVVVVVAVAAMAVLLLDVSIVSGYSSQPVCRNCCSINDLSLV
jgi:hypothetical protein